MSGAATAEKIEYGTVETSPSAILSLRSAVSTKEILLLGIALALLQVVDGILTGIGVGHLGTAVEGNVLIRSLMESVGYINALLIIKSIAMLVIIGICFLAARVRWLTWAMKAVIFIYLGAAVIPWSFVIARHVL